MERALTLRRIRRDDAEGFFRLNQELRAETEFLLLEPGEGPDSPRAQGESLDALLGAQDKVVFVAEAHGVLVGFLGATRGGFARNRHCANFAMGVCKRCWGQGVGTQLLAALEAWARTEGVSRLEMTVAIDNERARDLYERAGFQVEGRRRGSLRVGQRTRDEYFMARLLDGPAAGGERQGG